MDHKPIPHRLVSQPHDGQRLCAGALLKTSAGAAVSALMLVSTAHAIDGSVTLYGKIDAFGEYDSGGSQGNRLAFDSGGVNGTRWGMKGETPLASVAPDLKAIFQIEGGLFVNNGNQAQGGRLFGRQAYVGASGGFGTLTLGRQYTPLVNTVVNFDSFGQAYGSPTNDGQVSVGLDTRYDNALIYATPNLGGLTANAMAALGGKTGNSGHDAFALSVDYSAAGLDLGAVYQRDDHNLAVDSAIGNFFAGASYKIGVFKVMGGFGSVRTSPDGGAALKRNEWLLGTTIDVTQSGQLWLDYGTGKTNNVSPSDKSTAYSAAWMQSITKQARAYVVASIHKNGAGAALVPQGTSSSGAYTISPGDTARGLAVGFQYDF